MDELEDFVGCKIKCDLSKMAFNISQIYIINKMTQLFKEDLKSLMTFNAPDTPHDWIVRDQEIDIKSSYDLQNIYMSGVGLLL